ncbi:MarR family transcriptional regulator [Mycoplasma marinum]|uniref:HTH marR-type domain-containing protein n=1 Tax=Mycoplasma marinum TaxID=1937190 RepID=A0A4R0XY50_9MOLU|nr:MarR family transcriptional regulator [Mycoplasma marinum]TCG11989.1 hypothetical protein C4B24_00030 [Mycoplasma marinum]
MKSDYFGTQVPLTTQFIRGVWHMFRASKDEFNQECLHKLQKINPNLNFNKILVINAIVFDELVTKQLISKHLKKDAGNTSKVIKELVADGIVIEEKVKGLRSNILSVNKKFYKSYTILINEFYQGIFRIHFLEMFKKMAKVSLNEDIHEIDVILSDMWHNKMQK